MKADDLTGADSLAPRFCMVGKEGDAIREVKLGL